MSYPTHWTTEAVPRSIPTATVKRNPASSKRKATLPGPIFRGPNYPLVDSGDRAKKRRWGPVGPLGPTRGPLGPTTTPPLPGPQGPGGARFPSPPRVGRRGPPGPDHARAAEPVLSLSGITRSVKYTERRRPPGPRRAHAGARWGPRGGPGSVAFRLLEAGFRLTVAVGMERGTASVVQWVG